MSYINVKIRGIPYSKLKSRGNFRGLTEWDEAVIAQTSSLPRVMEACLLKVTFMLPPDKFPLNFPYGPDLDNLLKRFLDALGKTIFAGAEGCDSCIVSIHAMKARVDTRDDAGASLEVLPVSVRNL